MFIFKHFCSIVYNSQTTRNNLYIIVLIILSLLDHQSIFAQNEQNKLLKIDNLSSKSKESSITLNPYNFDLYFSRMNQNGDLDVKRAKWDKSNWTNDNGFNWPFNNSLDNEIMHIDSIQNEFYYQKAISDNTSGKMIYGIFKSKFSNSSWSKAQKLNIQYFRNQSKDQSFCLNKKSDIMIISMQGGFSYGVEDLYVSFKIDSLKWSEPKNLGNTINTKFEEYTPFLDQDERTLYFSSNGHLGGYGSKDIWVSYRLDDTWTNWSRPLNLGPQVNTTGMETDFKKVNLPNWKYLVCSSKTSSGESDIFGFNFIDPKVDSLIQSLGLEVSLTQKNIEIYKDSAANLDSNGNNSILVDTLIQDTFNTNLINDDFQLIEDSTNQLIIRVFNKQSNTRIYAIASFPNNSYLDTLSISPISENPVSVKWQDTVTIHVFANNYLPQKRNIIYDNARLGILLREDFYLDSIEIGKIFQLQNVLFKRGTNELLSNSYEVLDLVIEVLKNHVELNIEIAGHTDNSGNAYLNQRLSEQRSISIKNYLISNEIDPTRILTIGYGGTKPIASNASEETMKLNRRVEFKLIQK